MSKVCKAYFLAGKSKTKSSMLRKTKASGCPQVKRKFKARRKTEERWLSWNLFLKGDSLNKTVLSPRLRRVMEVITKSKADIFLDIGCGDGSFSNLLKGLRVVKEAYGIEISPEAAAIAKKKGIQAVCLDIDEADFPFENDYFDGILAAEIIEHLLNPDHLLREIYRVLKSGGWAIISTPNLASWHSRLHLLFGYQPYPVPVRSERARYRVGSFMHPVSVGHNCLS